MAKELLVDYTAFDVSPQLIAESEKTNNGRVIVSGVLQRADAKNQNGRVYPKEILVREVKKYTQIQIAENRALGELDHPDTSVVNLANASHLVTEIWMDNNKCMGKIEVLNTPSGNVLKELVNANVSLGISSRGMGSIKEENGVTLVEDDFQLICFDMVSDPSTPGAFMMTEAKERSNIFTKADKINRLLNSIISEKV